MKVMKTIMFSLVLTALATLTAPAQPAPALNSLVGEWRGAITGGETRVFTLTIRETSGTLSGELSAMGGKAPVSALKFGADRSITFEIPNVMKFAGKATLTEGTMLSSQGDWMSGDVTATGLKGKWTAHKITNGGPELKTTAEYTARGQAHMGKRAFAEAVGDYSRAIALSPASTLYVTRAAAYVYHSREQKGSSDNMNAALEGFLGKKVDVEPTFALLSLDLAIDDLNTAIKLDTKSATAYNLRGLAWLSRCELSASTAAGDCGKAVQDLTQTIQLGTSTAQLYENRAQAYKKLGKAAEAEADLRKAADLKAGRQ